MRGNRPHPPVARVSRRPRQRRGRIVGEPVGSLRRKVHAELTGTTTCTHLNDVLRSLAGVAALARSLGD